MTYEQFVESRVKSLEDLLADTKARKVFYCASCDGWLPVAAKREDPLSDWPTCDRCLEDSGVDPDNVEK